MTVNDIETKIRNIPDFPKPGILFKDITPLLGDAETLNTTNKLLADPFDADQVDFVVGMESRGFLFGPAIAMRLNAGFVPVRKPGKLPYKTQSATYQLEYGTDSIEIHEDAIFKGARVVIHDDVVATGGTAMAATELVKRLGGVIVGYSFIIELTFLNSTPLLQVHAPVHSLIKV